MTAMQVQHYRKVTTPDWNAQLTQASAEEEERRRLCTELGLKAQLRLPRCDPGLFYPRLTRQEFRRWRVVLPFTYRLADDRWKVYDFDKIPVAVLHEIAEAKALGLFTDLEIWTPERGHRDPLVVGVADGFNGPAYFLISRWGESLQSPGYLLWRRRAPRVGAVVIALWVWIWGLGALAQAIKAEEARARQQTAAVAGCEQPPPAGAQ